MTSLHVALDARTATDHFPGIGRYVVNLAHALARIAPGLPISLLYGPSANPTRLSLPALPRLDCSASPFSLRQQWVVPGQLRRARAALYHSPYYLMPYRPGVPTIVTVYDLIPLVHPQYFSAAQRLIYRLAHLLALQTADIILAISQATKADLIRYCHLSPERVVVTPLAADAHFTPQSPESIASVRQRYALPGNYVLYFGSNKPHKNLVRLVEAFGKSQIGNRKLVLSYVEGSEIALVIAGHWDARYPQAKAMVERLALADRVVFLGPVPEEDLPALYSGATLFVFPSLYEGFGLPVLEAMACGAPVICSNTSSLPEVVEDAALMVNSLDTEELATAMSRVLADETLRQEMRQKGLAQAARFSWERTARETLAVYRQVAD